MKRAKNVFDEIVSWDNLYASWLEVQKGKRYKPDVVKYALNAEENITNLHNHLTHQSWQPGRYKTFIVHEPKMRTIEAPPLEDRIVHHAIHRVLEAFFERRFIKDSFACRKGKGTHAAAFTVQKHLRVAQQNWGKVYVYQADIAGYFPHIAHHILKRLIARVVGCARTLALWFRIIDASGAYGVGIPIGALTSQLSANIYLDFLDHLVKDKLGIKHYARYMDDFVILAKSKIDLHVLDEYLRQWLLMNLELYYSRSSIYQATQGVDFAGYRVWSTHILPRKKNVKAARKRLKAQAKRGDLKAFSESVASFNGYMKHCQGYISTQSTLNEAAMLAY